jgi:FAD synthetase
VQHFDEAVRRTTYEAFIEAIQRTAHLAGLLMTPDSAFGFERRGTAGAVAAMGEQRGFDVVVVPPFTIDGGVVSSSEIRAAIERGDLATAERLLGRPVGLRGTASDGLLAFDWPMALPPDGQYPCRIDGRVGTATVHDGVVRLSTPIEGGSIDVELVT